MSRATLPGRMGQPTKQTPPTKENPTRQRHQAASGGAKH